MLNNGQSDYLLGDNIKFRTILSVAIVACFITASFAVAADASADSSTTDYSSGANISVKDLTQSQYEGIAGTSYYGNIDFTMVLSDIFSNDVTDDDNYKSVIKFDKISETRSLSNKLEGEKYCFARSIQTSFDNLTVTLTYTSTPSSIYTNETSFEDFNDIIKYFGSEPIKSGTVISIAFSEFENSSTLMYSTKMIKVADGKYVPSQYVESISYSFKIAADITIGDKSYSYESEYDVAVTTTSDYVYGDTENYTLKSSYVIKNDVKKDGFKATESAKIDGKNYGMIDVDMDAMYYDMASLFASYENQVGFIKSYVPSLSPDQKFAYDDIYSKLDSDNDKAAQTISDLGGKCSLDYNESKDIADDVYSDSKTSSGSGSGSNTGLIVALVIVSIIAVALAVVLIIKTKKA